MVKNLIKYLFILVIYSCGSNDSAKNELNISIQIEGGDNSGEVRLQKVNSDYSIELIQSGNFIENTIMEYNF